MRNDIVLNYHEKRLDERLEEIKLGLETQERSRNYNLKGHP